MQRLRLVIGEKWHQQQMRIQETIDRPFDCLYQLHRFFFPTMDKLEVEIRCGDSLRAECLKVKDELMEHILPTSFVIEEIE